MPAGRRQPSPRPLRSARFGGGSTHLGLARKGRNPDLWRQARRGAWPARRRSPAAPPVEPGWKGDSRRWEEDERPRPGVAIEIRASIERRAHSRPGRDFWRPSSFHRRHGAHEGLHESKDATPQGSSLPIRIPQSPSWPSTWLSQGGQTLAPRYRASGVSQGNWHHGPSGSVSRRSASAAMNALPSGVSPSHHSRAAK